MVEIDQTGATLMKKITHTQGWTLVELMITVAIIGVLASIAIPSYNGYIETSQHAAAKKNAVSLAGFVDTYFYENDSYLEGTYTPGGTDTLRTALDWSPTGDESFKYVVTAETASGTACNITECYTVTVTLISDTSISQTVSRP